MKQVQNTPFLWGAATSSHQVEGGNIHNDWWRWESEGNIEGGVGSGAATDHWNLYREDLRMAAGLGLNSYRFSVEWSRFEPEPGRWEKEAEDWYLSLIDECEKNKIIPMLTLHHFTSPTWFADRGGFTAPDAHEAFGRFVRKIAQRIGPRVPLWCTVNEPMVLISGTYLARIMPPAKFDPKAASLACAGLLRSHVAAYDILHSAIPRREGPWRDRPLEVGMAHNMMDFMPDRPWHPIERLAAKYFHRFYNLAWLESVMGLPQRFSVPFFIPNAPVVKEALGRKTADFIGVNYYTKGYVQFWPRDAAHERAPAVPLGLVFARRKEPASDMEWAVHPKGFGKMLRLAGKHGLPIYVTENGIADRADRLRPSYLMSHLAEVAQAIEEGVPIRGYYYWSLLDNFEWIKGFGPRFGLFQVDFSTFERKPTASARLLQKMIGAHESGIPRTDILRGVAP